MLHGAVIDALPSRRIPLICIGAAMPRAGHRRGVHEEDGIRTPGNQRRSMHTTRLVVLGAVLVAVFHAGIPQAAGVGVGAGNLQGGSFCPGGGSVLRMRGGSSFGRSTFNPQQAWGTPVEIKVSAEDLKKNMQRVLEKQPSGVMGRDLRRTYKEVTYHGPPTAPSHSPHHFAALPAMRGP